MSGETIPFKSEEKIEIGPFKKPRKTLARVMESKMDDLQNLGGALKKQRNELDSVNEKIKEVKEELEEQLKEVKEELEESRREVDELDEALTVLNEKVELYDDEIKRLNAKMSYLYEHLVEGHLEEIKTKLVSKK